MGDHSPALTDPHASTPNKNYFPNLTRLERDFIFTSSLLGNDNGKLKCGLECLMCFFGAKNIREIWTE